MPPHGAQSRRVKGGVLTILVGMVLCFSSGICLGIYGFTLFLLVSLGTWAVKRWYPDGDHRVRIRRSAWPFVLWVGAFFWGYSHHGDFRSLRPGRFQIIATGSSFSSRGALALVEGAEGRTLIGLDRAVPTKQAGLVIQLRRCGYGRWMIPGRCLIQDEPGANLRSYPERSRASFRGMIFALRRRVTKYLDGFGASAAPWLKALLLGLSTNSNGGLLESFRGIGLLHFLVVSGSHVTLVHRCASGCVFGIRRVASALFPALPPLASGPNGWTVALGIVATTLFCLLSGLEPPVQRALCGLCVGQALAVAGSRFSRGASIASTFLLQAFIWPVGFLSRSNFLSWMAWLIVLLAKPVVPLWSTLARACFRQVSMAFALAALTGFGTCAGIIANLVFLPVLEMFFIFCLVVVFAGPGFGALLHFNQMVQSICDAALWVSQLTARGIYREMDGMITHPWVRVAVMGLAWLAVCFYTVSTLRDSKIPPESLAEATAE